MRRFRVWLDSGANIHSIYEKFLSLKDIGCSEEEFDAMSADEKEQLFRDVAWDRMDWGYEEIG